MCRLHAQLVAATMHIWRHQLKFGLPSDSDGMLVGCTGLVVKNLKINCKTTGCQPGHDGIVLGSNAALDAPGLEGLLKFEVAIGLIGNQDILVARVGLDREAASIVHVELADGEFRM